MWQSKIMGRCRSCGAVWISITVFFMLCSLVNTKGLTGIYEHCHIKIVNTFRLRYINDVCLMIFIYKRFLIWNILDVWTLIWIELSPIYRKQIQIICLEVPVVPTAIITSGTLSRALWETLLMEDAFSCL